MSEPISSPTTRTPAAIHPALGGHADADLPLRQLASDGLSLNTASPSSDNVRPKSSSATLGFPSSNLFPADAANSEPRNVVDRTEPWPAPSLLAPELATDANLPASLSLSPPRLSEPRASGHKRNALSIESVPRQTIMKALASVARNNKPQALSLNGMLSAHSQQPPSGADNRPSTASSQQLCDALNDIAQAQNTRAASNTLETPTANFTSLQSPCFYHERFDDAVDFDKVLEEIKNDEWMSHSRLVQTATGVREVSKQLQRRPIKRDVKNIMIVTKARDNQLVLLTRELASWLLRTPRYGADVGVNVYVDAKLRNSKRFGASSIIQDHPRFQDMLRYWTPDLCWSQPEKFDLVLTLGGDGTVLFTSWLFQRIVPPVLSFSLGSLGFLTNFEFEKYKDHLNRIMGDDGMRVNLRMRFTCTVYRDGPNGHEIEEGEQFEVLNELVIDRGPSPYVSNLELYGDNELLTVIQADGCIFSTPTGSTAYSLSAGGSLVHPDIPAILLTPICPHTLSFRPMVLSDTMLLRVSIPHNSRATAYCAFDGKGRVELRQGDHVTITASQYPFPTVVRTDAEWFDSVSRTLRWNVRAATQKSFETGGSATGSEDGKEEDDGWDIDTDSACYVSEDNSIAASPLRRQMSLLGM
ncbi:ATP-NAD kinase-like domain-containing protein [Cercophora newfieldiana]|uniref:ATP-NAD kinase-like domain-containing protein n=1 Tax=Cercophora newfieldiana TaxID=92897 RepID=A0AA40D0R2_9PEZI|nr:ATP-NAD kinase-like domain-containing protein [Cercophora newfieldiana]